MNSTTSGIAVRLCTLFLFLLSTFTLLAQVANTGAVVGTVKDKSGAVIAGAKVEIVNQGTGVVERTLNSTSDGRFTATLLPVGTYIVRVSAPGFSSAAVNNIPVQVTETRNVPVVLQVGAASQTVEVTAAASQVQTESAATGETIGSHTVSNLPLSTRNFLTLLTLSSGANTELFNGADLGRGAVTINVNGERPTNNNYELEGVNVNDVNLPINTNVPIPNPDTVQEFKTQTSLYDASEGRNGGGNIQVALKPGGKNYHGDFYNFFRNNVLDANDFFNNHATPAVPRPVLRQNQFGASFGGPVPAIKDFFFFGNYQGTREASGAAAGTNFTTQIPVLPANRSAANLQAIFFPSGFPTGFTAINPVAIALLNLPASKCPIFNDGTFCIPTLAGAPGINGSSVNLATITRTGLGVFDDNQFVVDMDKQLTNSDKLTGRYFWDNFSSLEPFGNASTLPFQKLLPQRNRFLKLGETHIFSPRLINDFRFGFNRFFFAQVPSEPISLADLGATRGNSGSFPAAFQVSVSGDFSIGTGVNDDRGGAFNTFFEGDDLSWSIGKHTFRVGGEVSRYQLNRFNNFAQRGNVTFGNTFATNGIDSFQNFLLGNFTNTQAGAGFATFYFRATDFAGYLQDDWKATPRLTLNLGVRYEGLSTAHEKRNFLSNFGGLTPGGTAPPAQIIHPAGAPVVGTPGVSDCTLLDCLTNNFAPRVGFSYDLFGDQKTVLRGGYGVYYQRVSNQSLLQTAGGFPFAQAVSDFFGDGSGANFQNPFPSILPQSAFPLTTPVVIPTLTSFTASGKPVFTVPTGDKSAFGGFNFYPVRDFKAPFSMQYNLTMQHEFFKGWIGELGYVGSRGERLLGPGKPLNPAQICTLAAPCVIPASIAAGATVAPGALGVVKNSDGSISITASTAANANARVPLPFLGLANNHEFLVQNDSQSSYNSLQTSLVHQFSSGLYLQAAYTFSHSVDNASGSTFTDELNGITEFGEFFNNRTNRGTSDFDRTHRFVISYNYELPFAKILGIQDHGIGKLANGWSINGLTTFQSGTPFMIFDSSAANLQDPGFNNGSYFATLAPGATLGDVLNPPIGTPGCPDKIACPINLNAFQVGGNCVNNQNQVVPASDPTCTGFAAVGNVGRNLFRGPYQQNWDMSFIKTTTIGERASVDFRAEFFNIFNHPNLQSPQAAGGSVGNYGEVDVSSGTSAVLGTVGNPRIIQFALKFNF